MPMDRPESVIQRGFAGGELAPVMHARADSPRYVDGLRTCKNFMVLRHGAVANRPGWRFVNECKTTSANVRLRRFVHSTPNESILVEIGVSYFRFYKNGARIELAGAATAWSAVTNYVAGDLVSEGGVNYYAVDASLNEQPPNAAFWHPLTGLIYEIPHTYTTAGLIGGWEQSGNVITITHRLHDPRELVYFADTNWVLRDAITEPTVPAPVNLTLTPGGGAGTEQVAYVITAAGLGTLEESLVSNVAANSTTVAPTAAVPHLLEWDAPTDPVEEYYVYKDVGENGVFGYIGTAKGAEEFRDTGLTPDYNVTPPLDRTPFVSADTRPHVATHYQQRRFYAGSNATPDGIEASRVGFINNFGISSPSQDDDALTFRMVGYQQHAIRHMRGLKRLLVFTDGGIWTVGRPNEPLTPATLGADQETYAGVAADVVPVNIGNTVIYVQARGSIVRDVRFDQEVEGLNGRDLTLFASHLFDAHVIESMDYAETPHSIVWACRDDGVLLGLTYVRELDVWGWHRHETVDGDFEQVCTVPEADGDAVYCVVGRNVNGNSVRYIERLAKREIRSDFFNLDSFFVDSGLSYDGAPADTFAGLDHLEGEDVIALGDGDPVRDVDGNLETFTVSGGSVTLPALYSRVHIGLAITADLETLDLDVQGSAIRDKKKRVGSLTVLVDKSSRVFAAGPDTDSLTAYELSGHEAAADEHTGQVEINLSTHWNEHGRVFIRQSDPLPLTILGIIPNLLSEG